MNIPLTQRQLLFQADHLSGRLLQQMCTMNDQAVHPIGETALLAMP
jgi:hypothetical protein